MAKYHNLSLKTNDKVKKYLQFILQRIKGFQISKKQIIESIEK